ncbi:MAG: CARDB domain-containing protein [Candidatus Thermoplasmatota archaeon]|nr:CARDB domain-containing protein [Candidatus Thermoplasmatota archaeon]
MERPAVIMAFVAIFLLFIASAGYSGRSGSAPDLEITAFDVTGSVDGYALALTVRNNGVFPSEQVWASVFDESDPVSGSGSQIARISIPSLDTGKEFSRTVDWFPSSGGSHRLWAIVDVENRGMEVDRMDNVASIDLYLPGITHISSPVDGVIDPTSIGWAFSGVSAEFPIEIHYGGDPDPNRVKAYIQIGEENVEYAPTGPDGTSKALIDPGTLDPGMHELKADVTISGLRMTDNGTTLSIREVPEWISSMGSYRAYFDRDKKEYVFTGVHDVPTRSASVPIEGLGRSVPLTLCAGASEVYLEVRVLTDGTTTVSSRGGISIEIGGVVSTITMEGRHFATDPEDDMILSMQGGSDIAAHLGWAGNADGSIEAFPGAPFPLIDMPDANGKAGCTMDLKMGSGGFSLSASLSLSLEGTGSQALSDASWGLDSPFSLIGTSVEWETTHILDERGEWSFQGGAEGNSSIYAWDIGLSYGDLPQGLAPISSRGLSFLDMVGENASAVVVPQEKGSITHVTYIEGEKEIRLHGSNLYKSSPRSLRLPNGNVFISWTEASSYSSDPVERYSSLRVMYAILDVISGDVEGPFTFLDSTCFSARPVLIGNPGRPALFYLADGDSDPGTRDDMTLAVATFNGSGIDGMDNLTEGGILRSLSPLRTIDGDAMIAWTNGTYIGMAMVREDGSSSLMNPVTPGGKVISIAAGPLADGSIALAYSTLGKGDEPCSVEVLRTGVDGTPISGPIVVMSGEGIMDSLSLRGDPFETLSLSFRGSRQGVDSVYISTANAENGAVEWLPPLKAAAEPGVKLSVDALPLGGGEYLIGWMVPLQTQGRSNASMEGDPLIMRYDLSHAADVEGASHSAKGGYVPGDMMVVSAEVRNRGFRPDTEVSVEFIKALRDPLTGEVSGQSAGSRKAFFDSLGGLTSVDIPMLVSENQLGVHVVVVSPRWSGPDHESHVFLSIPAVADPVLKDVAFETMDNGTLRIEVRIDNRGSLSTGSRLLSVMGTERTRPAVLPGKLFEPSHLRQYSTYSAITSTTIHVDPLESRVHVFNVRPEAGVRYVTVALEGRPWENDILSNAVHRQAVMPWITAGSNISGVRYLPSDDGIRIGIANEGGCSLRDILELPSFDGPAEIGSMVPADSFHIRAGDAVLASVNVTDLDPGSVILTVIDEDLGGLAGDVGRLELRGEWDDSAVMSIGRTPSSFRLSAVMLPPTQLSFQGDVQVDTVIRTHRFVLGINNTSQHSVRCLVLNLHDGIAGEGELVASLIISNLVPGEVRNTSIPLDLEEGVFFLHLEVLELNRTGNGIYDVVLARSGEFVVKDMVPPDENGEKASREEVERSLIISGALATAIIVLAFINRAYEETKKGKE